MRFQVQATGSILAIGHPRSRLLFKRSQFLSVSLKLLQQGLGDGVVGEFGGAIGLEDL
jgi:hypothetical protein